MYLFLVSLLVVLFVSFIEALECVNYNDPKTRIFPTLKNFQANTVPFDCRLPECKGNWIEFSFDSINNLQRNSFITHQSMYIMKLRLFNKSIETIEAGAFESLYCLHILDLSRNKISSLPTNVFNNLLSLENLDLSNNNLIKLNDLSFAKLQNLKILNLSHNQIRNIQSLALYNLTKLEELYLNFNQLKDFDSNMFQSLVKLVRLDLSNNHLYNIEPETWKDLSTLEYLNLAHSELKRFDASYNFSFINLKSLNLSSNLLVQLNILGLRQNLPKLSTIDISHNQWYCEDLIVIIHQLIDSKIYVVGENLTPPQDNKGEYGIACQNISKNYAEIVDSTTSTNNIITMMTPFPNDAKNLTSIFNQILASNNKILSTNKKILDTAQFIQILSLVLFIIIIVFIVFQLYAKYNCCLDLHRRLKEEDNVEHFHLLQSCR